MPPILSTPYIPDIAPDADNLTAALRYAEAGLYVLPVKRSDPKNPGSVVGKGWQAKSSRNPKVLAAWFAGTDHNIALHCGRSGAVVFDVDNPGKLSYQLRNVLHSCPYQSSRPDQPERGHYVFAMPFDRSLGNSTGKLGKGWGQIRGLNGVIIVAPSQHSEAGEYRWERTGCITVLPDDIADQLDDASPAEDAATDEQVAAFLETYCGGDVSDLVRGPVVQLEKRIAEGESRHEATTSVAVWAMDEAAAGCYSADDAQAAIKEVFINSLTNQRTSDERLVDAESAADEFDGILAWAIGQASAKSADELKAIHDRAAPDSGDTKRKTLATKLVELGQDTYLLGVTPEGKVFGCNKSAPHVALPLKGGKLGLRASLAREFFIKRGSAPSQSALTDCCTVLEGLAREQDPRALRIRVAGDAQRIHIDMADAGNNIIEISDGTWHIVGRTPYMFGRTELTAPMAQPALPGTGRIKPLWQHVNVADEDKPVVLAVMIDALIQPDTSKTVAAFQAEHGSAKTSTMKRIVSLIDPSTVDARGAPRNEDHWLSQAVGSWVVALDNLSSISDWLSDCICRAATGDGSVKRALYSDDSLWVSKFRRCVMLTGIDLGGLRGDLTDRIVSIKLKEITDRRTEKELETQRATERSTVLGGLLDLAAKVHQMMGTVTIENLPRMADFGVVLYCVDAILKSQGMKRYTQRKQRMLVDSAISDSFIAMLMEMHTKIEDMSAADILRWVTPSEREQRFKPPADWPKKARIVSVLLNRHAPALRSMGWQVSNDEGKNKSNTMRWTLIPPHVEPGEGAPS